MRKRSTHKTWQQKLSESSVPDYQQGWQQMQSLLDKEMPASAKPATVFPLWKKIAAAAALLLLAGALWWAYPFKKETASVPAGSSFASTPLPVPVEDSTTMTSAVSHATEEMPQRSANDNALASSASPGAKNFSQSTGDVPDTAQAPVTSIDMAFPPSIQSSSLPFIKVKESFRPDMMAAGNHTSVPDSINDSYASVHGTKQALPAETAVSQEIPEEKASGNMDRKLHIGLRINANSNGSFGHADANYNPVMKGSGTDFYPAVSIGKSLSKKWSVQTGFAFASPVNVDNQHPSLSRSYRNYSINPAAQYSENNLSFDRLYYIDLPLTMQYHLGQKFSVGSGLQLSVLQRVIGEKQRRDYDANNVMVMAQPSNPNPQNITGSDDVNASLRPLDLRWVMGLQYHLTTRWEASVQYQLGLTDITRNSAFGNNGSNHNNFIQAGIGFNFR